MDYFHILAQMITSMRGCVAYNDLDLYLQGHLALALKTVSALWHLQFLMDYFHIWYKWSLAWGVSHVMTFDLDLYLQGHSTLTLKIVSAL